MAAICFNCKKGVMYGHNVSHAKNRTRRIFKPNLHSAKLLINGAYKRVRLCTKCQRTLVSDKKIKLEKVVEIQPQVTVTAA